MLGLSILVATLIRRWSSLVSTTLQSDCTHQLRAKRSARIGPLHHCCARALAFGLQSQGSVNTSCVVVSRLKHLRAHCISPMWVAFAHGPPIVFITQPIRIQQGPPLSAQLVITSLESHSLHSAAQPYDTGVRCPPPRWLPHTPHCHWRMSYSRRTHLCACSHVQAAD